MMKKRKSHAFGKDCYLLGKGKDGLYYWLEKAKWDCDWYWGLGYIKSYTNSKCPECSKDIFSHRHFDTLFLKCNSTHKIYVDAWNDFFEESVLTEKEVWTLMELMKTAYLTREYSDMLFRGSSGISSNTAESIIKNDTEYERINDIVIPEIMKRVYNLLS